MRTDRTMTPHTGAAFTTTPKLTGTPLAAKELEFIAELNRRADTIVDEKADRSEKQETFYRVIVRTDKNHLGTTEHPLPIIPGMVTTVEVLTGEKSVLAYMMKPARMLREEALRER